MESQSNSAQLEISRGLIKEDATKFATFGSMLLLFSLLPLDIDILIGNASLYSPFLFVALLSFICSKTYHKSYLICYSFILLIILICLGLLAVIALAVLATGLISIFNNKYYSENDDSSELRDAVYFISGILLLIYGFLLANCCMNVINAFRHSLKMKSLLPCKMKNSSGACGVAERD